MMMKHRWEHKIDKEAGNCECGLDTYCSGQDLVWGCSGHANERPSFLHGTGIYLPAKSLTAVKNFDPESLQVNSQQTGT